jgi:predicted transcriptional regulator
VNRVKSITLKIDNRRRVYGTIVKNYLSSAQREEKIMMNIADEQKQLLLEHMPEAQRSFDNNDIDQLLEDLDAKITEIGFDADYELNDIGLKLQKLYDELYDQN